MAQIKADYKDAIDNAPKDGAPCLLGTASADGQPEISPKGSVVVYNAENLAYWERSHRGSAANIADNPRVMIYYRNPQRAETLPPGAALRFYGTATVVTDDTVRNAIYEMIPEREQKADAERTGYAVMVRIDRITDLRGADV